MKITPKVHVEKRLYDMTAKIGGAVMQRAAAMGLNEDAQEQRRQSITSITASTGVPKSRVSSKMKVVPAIPGPSMTAIVQTSDQAVMLHEYSNPVWNRTMPGAEVTTNRTKVYKGSFVRKGYVLTRTSSDRYPLKVLPHVNPANELAKDSRPNVAGRLAFAKLDLEKRVTRHILRSLSV